MEYAKKTVQTVFLVGLLVLVILSVLGTIYLSKMAWDKSGKCGSLSTNEKNIAKLTTIAIWLLFAWIVLGTFLKDKIWDGVF